MSVTDATITALATVVVAWLTSHADRMSSRLDKALRRIEELETWREEAEAHDGE